MHGAGNSFVLIENRNGELRGTNPEELAVLLCSGNAGFKADGMIVITPAEEQLADFGMMFYNSNGSVGEMCGNGARCIARYGVEHGLAKNPEEIRIAATAGLVLAKRITQELYEVRLNDPSVIDLHQPVPAFGTDYDCSYVELGDPGIPHAVVETAESEIKNPDRLRELGRALRDSREFPKGANVTFACVTGEHTVRAITFERGVEDFTLACDTGCGATAITLLLRGRIPGNPVEIEMPGGHLSVCVKTDDSGVHDVLLRGPTAVTGEGETEWNI